MFQIDGMGRLLQLIPELRVQLQHAAREVSPLHVWLMHLDESGLTGFNQFEIRQPVHLTHRLGHGDGSWTEIFIADERDEATFEQLSRRAGELLRRVPTAILPPGVPLGADFDVESALWIEFVFGVAWMQLDGLPLRCEQRVNVGGVYVPRAADEILAAARVWTFNKEMAALADAVERGELPLSHRSELSDFFQASLQALSFLETQVQFLNSQSDDELVIALRSLIERLERQPCEVLTKPWGAATGLDATRINKLCRTCKLSKGPVIAVNEGHKPEPLLTLDWLGIPSPIRVAIPDYRRSTPSARFRSYIVARIRDLLTARLFQLKEDRAVRGPTEPIKDLGEDAFVVSGHRFTWLGTHYVCDLTPFQVDLLTKLLQKQVCPIEEVMNRSGSGAWNEKYTKTRDQRKRISRELARLEARLFAIKPKSPPFQFRLARSADEIRRIDLAD